MNQDTTVHMYQHLYITVLFINKYFNSFIYSFKNWLKVCSVAVKTCVWEIVVNKAEKTPVIYSLVEKERQVRVNRQEITMITFCLCCKGNAEVWYDDDVR